MSCMRDGGGLKVGKQLRQDMLVADSCRHAYAAHKFAELNIDEESLFGQPYTSFAVNRGRVQYGL